LEDSNDKRAEERSNVFLVAALHFQGRSLPVRIRNISQSGALVDGPDLPAAGAPVSLSRGQLFVSGDIAWRDKQLAGVNFDSPVDVESWVRRVGHSGQQRVDGIVEALKRSEPLPTTSEAQIPPATLPELSAQLDAICERLAAMPELSIELGEELLRLDAIAQSLRQLARQ
jgi:hypothetical protein